MAGKFYAVKAGKKPGIYLTWDECKKQVDGFSCASYKSFKTREEAEAFMGLGASKSAAKLASVTGEKPAGPQAKTGSKIISPSIAGMPPVTDEDTVVAYVDGSYNVATKEFSYGMVLFYRGEEIKVSQKVDDKSLAEMRNVAGEIKGSEAAMRFAVEHGCKSVVIYHDYEGIAKWCTGEWKANKEGTQAYRAYYQSIQDKLDVEFVKVKGHSSDKYNDMADELAKAAIF